MPLSSSDIDRVNVAISRARIQKEGLPEFVRQAWHLVEPATPLSWNWHLDVVCAHVEALERGDFDKLVVNVPPGTMKSTLMSVLYPAWVWTFAPYLRFMFASHKEALALRDSVRRLMVTSSDWYQARWPLKFRVEAKTEFVNEHLGHMAALGAGGSTGFRGDRLVLDDPNDATEMESEVQRDTKLAWIDQQWSNRGNDGYRDLVIQQRTHEADVTGHLLKQGGFVHLKIPMRYAGEKIIGRGAEDKRTREGELLWPEVHSEARVRDLEIRLGPYGTAGQLQQSPVPRGGGIFKEAWLSNRWRPDGRGGVLLGTRARPLTDGTTFIVVDPAVSLKTTADYSAIGVFFWDSLDLVLLDLIRARMEAPEINPAIKRLIRTWAASVVFYEPVAFQLSLVQYGLREGIPAREIPREYVDRDKVSRAMAATPLMADGRFWLPEQAHWMPEYLHEMLTFPNGEHDDVVDCSTYASAIANHLPGRRSGAGPRIYGVKKLRDPEERETTPIDDAYGFR